MSFLSVKILRDNYIRLNEDIVRVSYGFTIDSVKIIKYKEKYGDNYKEVIQKKWDMRKLNRKLKNKLPLKNISIKGNKI